jgi:hypothetical protein
MAVAASNELPLPAAASNELDVLAATGEIAFAHEPAHEPEARLAHEPEARLAHDPEARLAHEPELRIELLPAPAAEETALAATPLHASQRAAAVQRLMHDKQRVAVDPAGSSRSIRPHTIA